ncbi:DinB family protein [Winogradskyella bathintestinalis]|uniref:DinB family protein n=1 Tax=Winogradskyella bathintestinalis TaxID=3035208 RepID=A0ABT7ZVY3_9FLAO|nr:DinB family protein [Winogradskyella bathintestinalis]MDN3493158.1 DinB family protein [Winogradskyella bathintestinalis]
MITDTLIKLYKRDLNKLIEEIKQYKDESNLWKIKGSLTNSAGTLCLHLIGNLNHFIGATFGNSGYKRQRELEFTLRNVSKSELIRQVEETIIIVENTLEKLTEEDLKKAYNRRELEEPMTAEYFLIHLTMHLAYHLGQITYHRRLLD